MTADLRPRPGLQQDMLAVGLCPSAQPKRNPYGPPAFSDAANQLSQCAAALSDCIGIMIRLSPTTDEDLEQSSLDAAEERFDERYKKFLSAMSNLD